eukprot:scaffold1446_cov127-Isochrysis_galbana.AAC.4
MERSPCSSPAPTHSTASPFSAEGPPHRYVWMEWGGSMCAASSSRGWSMSVKLAASSFVLIAMSTSEPS